MSSEYRAKQRNQRRFSTNRNLQFTKNLPKRNSSMLINPVIRNNMPLKKEVDNNLNQTNPNYSKKTDNITVEEITESNSKILDNNNLAKENQEENEKEMLINNISLLKKNNKQLSEKIQELNEKIKVMAYENLKKSKKNF